MSEKMLAMCSTFIFFIFITNIAFYILDETAEWIQFLSMFLLYTVL